MYQDNAMKAIIEKYDKMISELHSALGHEIEIVQSLCAAVGVDPDNPEDALEQIKRLRVSEGDAHTPLFSPKFGDVEAIICADCGATGYIRSRWPSMTTQATTIGRHVYWWMPNLWFRRSLLDPPGGTSYVCPHCALRYSMRVSAHFAREADSKWTPKPGRFA